MEGINIFTINYTAYGVNKNVAANGGDRLLPEVSENDNSRENHRFLLHGFV